MFYGQQELDRVIYERFFNDKKKGFFVECGAFDGISECTCKFFEDSMEWTGLNIEPVPYAYKMLVVNRPKCINENCALSSTDAKLTFTNAIHPVAKYHFGNGSLSHSADHKRQLVNMGCTFEESQVDAFCFSTLYAKHSLPDIDLFVLDVEGHEAEALKGILTIPEHALPQIFCIEHTITGLNEIKNMISKNYIFDSSYNQNSFFVKVK